jgi:hypothetical protein
MSVGDHQLRREHASVQGLARRLGTVWRTVWRSIKPLLEALAGDESRFDGVTTLGVDEHLWHLRWAKGTRTLTPCWPGAGYRLGSDRGSPNHGSTLLSKRVMAQIRLPARVST